MSKKSQKQLTDIFLAFLLILLMSSQSTEQRAHEYIGVFALFVVLVHQILNSWWYKLKFHKFAYRQCVIGALFGWCEFER